MAWFILCCTLHYPHLLAGQRRALPEFALDDEAFMAAFFKAQGVVGQRALREALDAVGGRRGGKSAHHVTGSSLLPMAVETQRISLGICALGGGACWRKRDTP